ncbi:MAG: DNA internalization-related competence protein ComEC/Rec2 [Pseudomonadota bacterium]
MNLLLLAFVAGVLGAAQLEFLPDPTSRWWLACLTAPAAILANGFVRARWIACAWCGVFYVLNWGGAVLAERLPASLAGQDLALTGTIVALPRHDAGVVRFLFERESIDAWPGRTLITLSWYARGEEVLPDLRPGQRWQLTARLNRPRGSVNPGLFDYEGWMLARQISATGYVRMVPAPVLENTGSWRALHHQLRLWFRDRILAVLPESRLHGLILALTLGESNAIGAGFWNTLSRTGTNHLLIISGLHVGLVAGMGFALCRFLLVSRSFAALLSLLLATFYGAVAGFGLPVQRSLVMTACAFAGAALCRFLPVSSLFCLALVVVVLVNPFAVLGAGFWLSFGAVGILLYAFAGRISPTGKWRLAEWLRSQWVVFVGTAPLLATTVFQVSLVAPIANLLAIPLVGVLLVPLLLVALFSLAIFESLGSLLLRVAVWILEWVWQLLEVLAALDWVAYMPALPIWSLLFACAGALVALAPVGLLPRWLGACLLLPLLCAKAPGPGPGEVWVDVLDVGQGLAVVVQTAGYRLLYDTGPAFGSRFDAGEQVVVPWLRRGGAARYLDVLVVSHGDIDHAGGAAAILRNFTIDRVLGIAAGSPVAADCALASEWQAGATHLAVLSSGRAGSGDNAESCVLLISHGDFHLLLPGDIEQAGERALVMQDIPPVDLLLVPHHGSRSSSTPAFINLTRPTLAIYSTGYGNRFGHPDKVVAQRYARRGVRTANTATDGAIQVRYHPVKGLTVHRGRQTARRFWYD